MKLIHYITVAVTVLLVLYLVWGYTTGSSHANSLFLWTTKPASVDYSLANNERMNEVPTTSTAREGFALTTAQSSALTELGKVTDPADKSTIATSLASICRDTKPNVFTGFRSLQSGATFKLEKVKDAVTTPAAPAEYIIHAIHGKVVTVDKATKTLTLAVKDTASNTQRFKAVSIGTDEVAGVSNICPDNTCKDVYYLESVEQPGYALQYEHEQLSLRPIISPSTKPKVFLGQAFVTFSTTDAELEASALSLGYPLGLDGEELQPGIRSIIPSDYEVATSTTIAGAGAVPSSSSGALADLTNAQIKAVLDSVVPDIKSYIEKTGGEAPKASAFGQKEGELTINVNLDEAGKDTFQDLTGETNQAQNSVRALLAAYTRKQQGVELGGIPAVGEQLSAATPKLGDVLLGKLKSCPAFDRSKYLTERQIAQCSGCSPDPYLRGQL
jgi:hypothetical protein